MVQSLYIFGYGSLISADGINGRGMKKIYIEEDLIPAKLCRYKREWNAVHEGIRYLGCVENFKASMNGVLFRLNPEDFNAFQESEMSLGKNRLYTMESVDRYVEAPVVMNERIYTCLTTNPSSEGTIQEWYVNIVREGLKIRGKKFTENFWKTTPSPYVNPKYHRISNQDSFEVC